MKQPTKKTTIEEHNAKHKAYEEELLKKGSERAYRFPAWVTEEMKENFYGMWRCFDRSPIDYYHNDSTELNGKICIGQAPLTIGEYFHKWNNIGWIHFDGKVYTVCNAKLYEDS